MKLSEKIGGARVLDRIGLIAIGIFSFAYSLWTSDFAETALRFPFLDFPVFVGEILMFFCLILLLAKFLCGRLRPERWHYYFAAYMAWVVAKALFGYFHGGPLAFRNAALFYYPVFAVLGYHLYYKDFFKTCVTVILAAVLGSCLLFHRVTLYFWWAYVGFYFILALSMKNKSLKTAALGFGGVLLVLNFPQIFADSRSHVIGMAMVFVYFICCGGILLYRRNPRAGLLFPLVLMALFIVGTLRYSDRNGLKTLTTPRVAWKTFVMYGEQIEERKSAYVFRKLPVRLYHDNKDIAPPPSELEDLGNAETGEWAGGNDRLSRKPRYRSLDTAYGNIAFRLLIWRDMWREFLKERPWFGFSFSWPQRSPSLEILDWARIEWAHDGWITPHNSFFHIFYRAGIPGVFMVLLIWALWFVSVRDFMRRGTVTGVLLSSIVLYWLTIANFLVFLELPYNAIPFWSTFGLTLAYWRELRKEPAP